jgi:hypothetical protein
VSRSSATLIWQEPEELSRPARHGYQVGSILLFLRLVLQAAASLRGASAVLKLLASRLGLEDRSPCANSGRLWLLRVGLFELRRSLLQAADWLWMMDHTIQLGPYKCLVIVGIRLSVWQSDRRALQHSDLTLLNLTPMEKATGEAVCEQLEATVLRTGIPQVVLSDEGTDLKQGMKLFRRKYRQVLHRHDFKHKNALLLKKRLEKNPEWQAFVNAANRTRLTTTQTDLAFLNPPSLKTKARYMNLDTLVHWAQKALAYLETSPVVPGLPVDQQEVHEKLSWLHHSRAALQTWSEWLTLIRTAEAHVQTAGYHRHLRSELRTLLSPLATTASSRQLLRDMQSFLGRQAGRLPRGTRVIGTTEVLESIIGKYKRLQSSHSAGGMTGLLLSIGAIVGQKSSSHIQHALEATPALDITRWCHDHFGHTLQSQRRLTLGAIKPT